MNLEGIELHWVWLSVAAVLGIAELIAPGIFLIWYAIAAAITGLAALILGVPLAFQFALFALLSIGTVLAGRRWYVRNPVASSDPLLNDRASRLIGRSVLVVEPVDAHRGRVRIGDSEWSARGGPALAGDQVRIVGIDGNCLKVEAEAVLPPS